MSDYMDISAAFDMFDSPPVKTTGKYQQVENTTMCPDWLSEWLYGNELVQILTAFTLGMVFSPWSYGIIFFFVFLVVWEILYYTAMRGTKPYWFFEVRLAIVAASILGWLVGRELTNKDADRLDPLLGRPSKKTRPEDDA